MSLATNLTSKDLTNDPHPSYRDLRDHEPWAWADRLGVWLVSRYEDVVFVDEHPRDLHGRPGALPGRARHGPGHDPHRRGGPSQAPLGGGRTTQTPQRTPEGCLYYRMVGDLRLCDRPSMGMITDRGSATALPDLLPLSLIHI